MSHQSALIASDIDAYLAQHERKELLRFITCGSVDDGKSTLIGLLSAVVDNVPLVAAAQGMYPLEQYPTDHYF